MEQLAQLIRAPESPEFADYLAKQTKNILSDWSYASGTSNHAKLGAETMLLCRVIDACTSPDRLPLAVSLIQEIVRAHLKVIYRCLFISRARQTVPALNLLTKIVDFAQGRCAADLYNSFDFTLKVIPKLLSSSDLRDPFVEFYLAFVRNSSSAVRRDLMGQRKIISGWFSKLKDDSVPLVLATLDTLRSCVIKDSLFSKTAKISLFNDRMLGHFSRLLLRQDETATVAADFLSYLMADKDYGLAFANNGWYGSYNNKQILAFLKSIKPWENLVQMDLTIKLLRELSELVAPYFDGLQASYSFMPKSTMFWFSFCILHLRAVQLPIPELDTLQAPPAKTVVANILPETVTKSSLNAALNFPSNLVRFQAAQLIYQALCKLSSIAELYQERVWDSAEIVNSVLERIPDVQLLLRPSQPELLQTCLLGCVREYAKLAPLTSSLPQVLTAVLDQEDVKGLQLVEAEDVLEIQAVTTGNTKWWNKAKDSTSLFTKLARFATTNPDLATQSAKLLQYLVKPTLALQTVTIASPIDVLLYSLEVIMPLISEPAQAKIWALLDESISRCVRAPYPYIDKYPTILSPLAGALVEQFAFVGKGDDVSDDTVSGVHRWLASFVRDLGVAGEDKSAVNSLLEQLGPVELDLPLDDYFEFVLCADERTVAKRSDIVFKISTPLELMATLTRAAVTPSLAAHLLNNIPAEFLQDLVKPVCFGPLVESAARPAFLATVRANELSSPELANALGEQPDWYDALDLVSTDFLIQKVRDNDHKTETVAELTRRGVGLPEDLVAANLEFADNIKLQTLDKATAEELMAKTNNIDSLAALVQASHFYTPSLPSDPKILLAASLYAPQSLDGEQVVQSIDLALANLADEPETALKLLVSHKTDLTEQHKQNLDDYFEATKYSLNVEMAQLAAALAGPGVQKWLKRVSLQLTKLFAEHKPLPAGFLPAFNAYLAQGPSIWEAVHSNSLNALLTAGIARLPAASSDFGDFDDSVELLARIVFAAEPGHHRLDHTQHLQTLLEVPAARADDPLVKNMLLWKLYRFDARANSTAQIQRLVLTHYGGLGTAADNLLLETLREIESHLSVSWVDDVSLWELRGAETVDEYEIPPLVTAAGTNLQVTLDKAKILAAVNNFDPAAQMAAPTQPSFDGVFDDCRHYDVVHPSPGYNAEFLINALVSCDYLVHEDSVDVKALAETGCLSFILCALASQSPDVSETARQMLLAVSATLTVENKAYKEHIGLRLIVNKMLAFLEKNSSPGYLAVMVALILPVVTSPSHPLHEKASEWLMAGPSFAEYRIPLFKEILASEDESKPRELQWLATSLASALIDFPTVNAFIKQGVFEWGLNQLTLATPKAVPLKRAVQKLINKAEQVGGGMALIARTAALSSVSEPGPLVNSIPQEELFKWMGVA